MITVFNVVLTVFKWILYLLLPFIIPMLFFFIQGIIKGKRIKKSEYGTKRMLRHGSKLKRLFIDFPRRFINDLFERDPDFFSESGVHVVAGEQGAGKTITVAYMLLRFKKMYPKCRIKTNFSYKYQDGEITHWRDVVGSENGIYGEIDVLDEMQTWFSSMQSKDFPPEMLTEISQQRKQRKMIIGTTQVFGRVSKPIREQVTLLYEPFTIFGCLTVVRVYRPQVSADDGIVDKKKLRKIFFFVHNEEIRNAFDTYKKISKYVDDGFQPRYINAVK